MGDLSKEPSMEDILSSIRRVIEREDAERPSVETSHSQEPDPAGGLDEPLELTEVSQEPDADHAIVTEDAESIVSNVAAEEARKRLARLATRTPAEAAAIVQSASSPTIEDMVRESLRPMLKAWLDKNLPDMVERIVTREVERITRGTD